MEDHQGSMGGSSSSREKGVLQSFRRRDTCRGVVAKHPLHQVQELCRVEGECRRALASAWAGPGHHTLAAVRGVRLQHGRWRPHTTALTTR